MVVPLIEAIAAHSLLAASSMKTVSSGRRLWAPAAAVTVTFVLSAAVAWMVASPRATVVVAMLASWTPTVIALPCVPSCLALTVIVSRPPAALRSLRFRCDCTPSPMRTNQQSDPPFSKKPCTADVTWIGRNGI